MKGPFKPTKEQLAAAFGVTIEDVIGPGLEVLFVGINPGLYSGATGCHFARPGNRFWRALEASGFTPRKLSPFEQEELLTFGLGITNLVDRATARADELSPNELRAGAGAVVSKLKRYRPRVVAFCGVTAYRTAFERRDAQIGPQPEDLAGSSVWVLPNPSGLNAHYVPAALAAEFARLRLSQGSKRH